MKTIQAIFLLLIVLSAAAVRPGTGNSAKASSGIAFHQGSWDEALELAKKENKLIFLDVYASWCGPCKQLKANTFTNAEVGGFYNQQFINVALNGETGEGKRLAALYKVRGYPSLLFLDGEGKVVTRSAGYHNPSQFIELGKKAIKN